MPCQGVSRMIFFTEFSWLSIQLWGIRSKGSGVLGFNHVGGVLGLAFSLPSQETGLVNVSKRPILYSVGRKTLTRSTGAPQKLEHC